MTAVETIGELFAGPGARDHLGEPAPIGEHMLQAGALAEAAGAESSLVAAACCTTSAICSARTRTGTPRWARTG